MTKQEINQFIEEMEELGDIWTPEQVERCYGTDSLSDALDARRGELGVFADIIGKVLNR